MTDEQKKHVRDLEDGIHTRLIEPWTNRLHDLILYKTMNAMGIRMHEIDRLIAKEVALIKPETKGCG